MMMKEKRRKRKKKREIKRGKHTVWLEEEEATELNWSNLTFARWRRKRGKRIARDDKLMAKNNNSNTTTTRATTADHKMSLFSSVASFKKPKWEVCATSHWIGTAGGGGGELSFEALLLALYLLLYLLLLLLFFSSLVDDDCAASAAAAQTAHSRCLAPPPPPPLEHWVYCFILWSSLSFTTNSAGNNRTQCAGVGEGKERG